jgi:hypothetical protein
MIRIPARKPFNLPMTCSVLISGTGPFVARALEFDIAAEAQTQRQATEKLAIALKTYITYGIANGWTEDILFDAPREYWSLLEHSEGQGALEPLNILDHVSDRNVVLWPAIVHDTAQRVACPA